MFTREKVEAVKRSFSSNLQVSVLKLPACLKYRKLTLASKGREIKIIKIAVLKESIHRVMISFRHSKEYSNA